MEKLINSQMESSWQKEIERLNATLIEDRKERYNRFAATSDLEPAVVRTTFLIL